MIISKSALESWLDMLIEARKQLLIPFSYKMEKNLIGIEYQTVDIGCIEMIDNKSIHIKSYDRIKDMADTLGVAYKTEDDGTDYYPIMRSFIYKGVKFFAQAQREDANED